MADADHHCDGAGNGEGGGGIAKKSSSYYREQQSALGSLNGYIEETVTGQNVVKVFCHEEKAVEDFTSLNDSLREKRSGLSFSAASWGR